MSLWPTRQARAARKSCEELRTSYPHFRQSACNRDGRTNADSYPKTIRLSFSRPQVGMSCTVITSCRSYLPANATEPIWELPHGDLHVSIAVVAVPTNTVGAVPAHIDVTGVAPFVDGIVAGVVTLPATPMADSQPHSRTEEGDGSVWGKQHLSTYAHFNY